MADFLSSDINDAKKRVEEMRKKAQGYINPPSEPPPKPQENSNSFGFISDIIGSLFSSSENESSTGLILAIILILSREGGNNKLILALLYILL